MYYARRARPELTVNRSGHTISRMSGPESRKPAEELQSLEAQLQELLNLCERLKTENKSLRNQQDILVADRASLIEKNEKARTRVEAMISRLKAMENSQ
jgi:cell division protein ZapB